MRLTNEVNKRQLTTIQFVKPIYALARLKFLKSPMATDNSSFVMYFYTSV